MKKVLLIVGVIVVFGNVSFSQSRNDTIQQLKNQIQNLEDLNSRLSGQVNRANSNIRKLEDRISTTTDSVNSLRQELDMTNKKFQAMAENLDQQIRQLSNRTNSEFSVLGKKVSRNTILYWILASLAIVLIPAVLFIWLRNRLTLVKTELSDQIKTSTDSIRSEIIKLDNQVFWTLDLQKNLSQTEENESDEKDHSLALKVADEIVRIQRNISNMDPDTKGLKQLGFAVDRIQDDFKEKGYEVIELLNKPWDPGMKISAKFKLDETLKASERIITRIIKPQVNFNDTMIQEAQVEVSVGKLPSA